MIRLVISVVCLSLLTACAWAPEPRDKAVQSEKRSDKPDAPPPTGFSHIEIGGG